jgi:chromosome segregation ATPase
MSSLTRSLVDASAELDRVLKEIAEISEQRESAVVTLESQLQELANREKQLQEKVSVLEKVPLPAIEHFVKAVQSGEKRSALRDYILFGLGVIVSTVIAIVLKLIFGI